MRIVTLLPAATEIVCHLGLEDHAVGVSHQCDFPPAVRTLPKLTSTWLDDHLASAEVDPWVRQQRQAPRALYRLGTATRQRLAADLIVTPALCDVCAVAEADVVLGISSVLRS